jgi:hypothetical protein
VQNLERGDIDIYNERERERERDSFSGMQLN